MIKTLERESFTVIMTENNPEAAMDPRPYGKTFTTTHEAVDYYQCQVEAYTGMEIDGTVSLLRVAQDVVINLNSERFDDQQGVEIIFEFGND